MIEIALSTATQRRPFLPFLPLTVSQRCQFASNRDPFFASNRDPC